MKVTSLKDVETYLYSSVIIPLKQLNVRQLDFPSPISSNDGRKLWTFRIAPEPPRRRYRRNYQNTLAQRRANLQILLSTGNREYVVATYNSKTHWIKVYERPFKTLGATPILGKLYEILNKNTPFTKIISELDPPTEGVYRNRHGETTIAEESPDYDDNEGYDEEIGY